MSDESVLIQPVVVAPALPDYHEKKSSDYIKSVAAKKISWALAKFLIAKGSTPIVLTAWDHFSEGLKSVGITIIIDHSILSTALPGLIFMGLVASHDYLKVKFPNIKIL